MPNEKKEAPLKLYRDRAHFFYDRDNETAGRIIKALLHINDGDEPNVESDITDIVGMLGDDIKQAREKYTKICSANRANAEMRWKHERMRTHANAYCGDGR